MVLCSEYLSAFTELPPSTSLILSQYFILHTKSGLVYKANE